MPAEVTDRYGTRQGSPHLPLCFTLLLCGLTCLPLFLPFDSSWHSLGTPWSCHHLEFDSEHAEVHSWLSFTQCSLLCKGCLGSWALWHSFFCFRHLAEGSPLLIKPFSRFSGQSFPHPPAAASSTFLAFQEHQITDLPDCVQKLISCKWTNWV